MGVNYAVWFTHDYYGEADVLPLVPTAIDDPPGPAVDTMELQIYIDTMRALSWWVPKYGMILDQGRLEGNK